MVSASSVILIALTVTSVSLACALIAVTIGFSVDLAIYKGNNNEQQNAIQSSLQVPVQQLIQDVSAINASRISDAFLQQLIQDIAVINASLQVSNSINTTNVQTSGSLEEVQSQIMQLNTTLNELSQLIQPQLLRIDQVNISLSQQIANVQAQIQEIIVVLESFGLQPFPASSCAAIQPTLPSGLYWIRDRNGNGVQVFCDMNIACGNVTGGWTRIISLDFNNSDACRNNFTQRMTSNLVVCEPLSTLPTGCVEVDTFSTYGVNYTSVCGRVIAYQFGTPEAFARSIVISSLTIDSQYLDGISLTHGSSPREHIWSFPVGVNQGRTDRFGCPCNVGNSEMPSAFVGTNYFCDSTPVSSISSGVFYPDNPLFDGIGCDPMATTCCSFNNPPWFYRQLPQSTTDDIEMRICQDEGRSTEGTPIQIIDLYIR